MDTNIKDKFYFSHDSNARRDPKMIALISLYGFEGYGRFFAFIEILRELNDYRIDTSKAYIMQSVMTELMFDSIEPCELFIKDCINFELLETDGIFVWSNSLDARMKIFDEKRQYYKDKANKRWNNPNKNKNKNESKENKETEKKATPKPKKFASVNSIRDDKEFAEIKAEIRKKDEFNCLSDKVIEQQRSIAVDWQESKGTTYKNYKSFFFNWLRRYIDNNDIEEKTSKEPKMHY